MTAFLTKYGHSIPFIPGYREAHDIVSSAASLATEATKDMDRSMPIIHSGVELDKRSQESRIPSFTGFLKDYIEYFIVFEHLNIPQLSHQFANGLDIGGAEGHISRILKGLGRVERTSMIDIQEKYIPIPASRYASHTIERLSSPDYRAKFMPFMRRQYANFGIDLASKSSFWGLPITSNNSVDHLIIGDFMTAHLDQQFDLITAFLCMEYFDLEEFMQRIADTLSPGGTFVFIVNYWWWPVNSTKFVGHFPYASQRLDSDDLDRYIDEFLPGEKEVSKILLKYYHLSRQRPTLSEYERIAQRVGLEKVHLSGLKPRQMTSIRTPIAPAALEGINDFSFSDVLRDIGEFRSDVTEDDLKTAFAVGVFRKQNCRSMNLSTYIGDLKKTGYGVYKKKS